MYMNMCTCVQVKPSFGLPSAQSNSTKIVAFLSEAEKIYLFKYCDSALHLKVGGFDDANFH